MPHAPRRRRRLLGRVLPLLFAASVLGTVTSGAPADAAGARRGAVDTAGSQDFVTRSGSTLLLDGAPFRFAGANLYWLGLDDNLRDAAGRPTYPSHYRVADGLAAARSLGATVVRAHTLGISVGCARCLEPSLGHFNDRAFAAIDYAVATAGVDGLRLIIPLTDQWHYFHGGKHTFTNWAGYRDLPGQNPATSAAQKALEAHFYTDPAVIADFEAYLAHLLDHVNRYTGVALRDDPTVLAWETGNELWDAPPAWTETIAGYLKRTLGARQLVADGSAASGNPVTDAALDEPDVDLVGDHLYPLDTAQATADAATAAAAGKAFFVGEYDWTGGTAALGGFLGAMAADPAVSGDLLWTILPRMPDGTPEPHGDGYAMWVPGTTESMAAAESLVGKHAAAMAAG